jgi:sugar phosphate isomerase/epimerase
MDLKLGFFSGAIHEWKASDVVTGTAEAGFRAIEWELRDGEGHIRPESASADAEKRRRECERAGLAICCVSANPTLPLLGDATVPVLVEAAVGCGARLARVFAPPFDPTRAVEGQLADVRTALERHADRYPEHGVTLVIELSEETLLPSPELLRRACEGIDVHAVGALYDPANMLVEGNVAPPFALALLGDYLHHVHVKNERFVRSNGGWAPEIVQADKGLVDWTSVFAELRRLNYPGWSVIDHLSDEPSISRMAQEREVAERLWASAVG